LSFQLSVSHQRNQFFNLIAAQSVVSHVDVQGYLPGFPRSSLNRFVDSVPGGFCLIGTGLRQQKEKAVFTVTEKAVIPAFGCFNDAGNGFDGIIICQLPLCRDDPVKIVYTHDQ
jgi:hypothetical protein